MATLFWLASFSVGAVNTLGFTAWNGQEATLRTAGVRIQPRWIPGLSISADYYDIQVKNLIASIGSAQTIANLCYDSASLENPFCGLIKRAGATGGPRGEQNFRILEGTLIQSTANFAKSKVRGVDVQAFARPGGGGPDGDAAPSQAHWPCDR